MPSGSGLVSDGVDAVEVAVEKFFRRMVVQNF
jgi:hypothetical protein